MDKEQEKLSEIAYSTYGLKVVDKGTKGIKDLFEGDENLRFLLRKIKGSKDVFKFKRWKNGEISFNFPKSSKSILTFDVFCRDNPLESLTFQVDSKDDLSEIVHGYLDSFKIKTLTPELEEKIKNKYRLKIATMAGNVFKFATRQNNGYDIVLNFDSRDVEDLEINEKGDDIVINHHKSLYAVGRNKKYTKALVSFSSPSVVIEVKVPFNVPLDELMIGFYKTQNINRLKFQVYKIFSFLEKKTLPNKVPAVILKKYFQGEYLWERREKKSKKFKKKQDKRIGKYNKK